MTKKIICILLSAVLMLCFFAACDEDSKAKVNDYMLALEGTWEYSDETGTISYAFGTDGKGSCSLMEYKLPFTFSANETQLQLITDYTTLYEGMYGMSFDELVSGGYLAEQYRYATENYTYILNGDTLTLTDTAYSLQISDSDLASLVLEKIA